MWTHIHSEPGCHDKSASSTNQADFVDFILQRENQVKHKSIYRDREFTKLGYSAASILSALPYLKVLLNETHLLNQHVEIARMFLDSKFFLTELTALATCKPATPKFCEYKINNAICEGESKSILLQCGCEYGFGQEIDAPVCATQLHLLKKEHLAGPPTNNIPCERVIFVFDRKATAAKCRKKLFKAKSIRNDMILHQSSQRAMGDKKLVK